MNNYIKSLNLPICIVGMAKSGETIKKLLALSGVSSADVTTFDQVHGRADFSDPLLLIKEKNPETFIVSPGVPLRLDWLTHARQQGKLITSELNIAAHFITTEKIIGITGSLGKSTTTSLIGVACHTIDPHCFIGGNLGTPLSQYIIDLIEKRTPKAQWIALELSSYQLENCEDLKVDHAVLTYLSANHLDRYDNLNQYYFYKLTISKINQGLLFVNSYGGDAKNYVENHPPPCEIFYVDKNNIHDFAWEKVQLLGKYNRDNVAVAIEVIKNLGWEPSALNTALISLQKYKGLPHRMENIGSKGGVLFINDSKSTTIESVLSAAESALFYVKPSNQLILLLGGKDKGLPWINLSRLIKKNIHLIFFGQCGELIKNTLNSPSEYFHSLELALDFTRTITRNGDVVLLSPGGSSLDEFSHFEERGQFFCKKMLS